MFVVREAQAAGLMPTRILTGQAFQLRIQAVAVGVDLGEVVAAGDARALARGMPGGPGGEFVLFNQYRVGAALQGEVVQQAGAHNAATHNDNARVGFHEIR